MGCVRPVSCSTRHRRAVRSEKGSRGGGGVERARGQERASVIAREQRLDGLAPRQEEAWKEVSAMIDTKKPGEYDADVVLLKDLQALAARRGSGGGVGEE